MSSACAPGAKHERKHCPRCQREFECKAGSILLCQCQTVVLTAEHMEYINALYDDCLCAECLLSLRGEFNNRQHQRRIHRLSRG
ncbi:MAG TPA: hypothetical protein ENI97_01885 [Gammaproteobacteria bacterium]|nr:hypothetical protein [Gammaproteobacteria bacterium]